MNYSISVTSSYNHLSRYAFMMECECWDGDGKRCGFVKCGDSHATVGTRVDLTLQTPECASINLFLFVVPLSLPADRNVPEKSSFPVTVCIDDGIAPARRMDIEVNVWSGTNFSVSIPE